VYDAMSLAIASTFVIGIAATTVSLAATLLMPELALRRTTGAQEAASASAPKSGDADAPETTEAPEPRTYRPNPALD
jgi:hypothetical protein